MTSHKRVAPADLNQGATAPHDRKILAWGRPSDTDLVRFQSAGWHTAIWDEIDGAFCLTGGSWEGPFIDPEFWTEIPENPPAPTSHPTGAGQ